MYDFGMWFRNPSIPLPLLLIILSTALAQDNPVSIFSDSALGNLRPCASTCMDETSIAEWLRCRTPLMNGCFCRRGLTSIGRASLFDCAKAGCNGDYEVDGMALTSVYTSYCNEYLGQVQATESPASNLARPTGSSGGDRTTVETSRRTTDAIPTSTRTGTSAITTTPSASGGLSKGASIGLGFGIGVPALGIAWGICIWLILRRRKKMRVAKGIWNEAFKTELELPTTGSGRVVRTELEADLRGQAGPRSELE